MNGLSAYYDRRMWRILLLGAMSGFPWVLHSTSLSLWLQESEISRATIGWMSALTLVYALNFLVAPALDHIQLPWLSKKVGHRKAWIILCQTIIFLSLLSWTLFSPSTNLLIIAIIGLVIGTASASQDVVIDALRIEQINENEKPAMAAGAAMATIGWLSGYKLGGMISLFTSEFFESLGFDNYWQMTFAALSAVMVITNLLLILIPEIHKNALMLTKNQTLEKLSHFLLHSTWGPLSSFFRKNGISLAFAILTFLLLFKVGEAFMGRMSIVFYKEIGFSKSDIALYSKWLGFLTSVSFTLLGGFLAIRLGNLKALFFAGAAMAATNLMFTVLAWSGKNELLFACAVLIDDIAGAFATVAFVTFISLLVDRTYTATQYALLASIGNLGRTTMSSSSGALVDWLQGDWGIFFIITALMVIPSLIVLWLIRRRIPN